MPPLTSGVQLGPYEIVAAIGAGGMGEVYKATDTRLGRTVAVKVLGAGMSGTPAARERFEREARTVSRLNHPHICTLYDVGAHQDIDYLVMEYLEGETLASVIGRGYSLSLRTCRAALTASASVAFADLSDKLESSLQKTSNLISPSK